VNENASSLEWRGQSVEILRRPYQRSLNLKVRLNGVLRVTCGLKVNVAIIEKFILQCHDFIERSQQQILELRARYPRLEFVSGERVIWAGEKFPLEILWSWNKRPLVNFHTHAVELKIHIESTRAERQKAIARAYKKQAEALLPGRVAYWSERMRLTPTGLSIRGQRTRWGSCGPDGKINLNWKLVGAPARVADYVIIHELAHLREANHSSRFWKIVEDFCPDYRELRKWLKHNQYELEFLEPKSELHSLLAKSA
jgi:predicted metal-dependent hydrolase